MNGNMRLLWANTVASSPWFFVKRKKGVFATALLVAVAFNLGVCTGRYIERMEYMRYEQLRTLEESLKAYPWWLNREQAIALERHHGEGHLKILPDRAMIRRKANGKWVWIVVAREPKGR